MAQSGYTPIQLYYSTTGGATPTAGNLSNGELAINITDGKLFYKNGTNVYTIASKATSATTGTNVQLLANDGSGGFSNVTVGSGLTFAGGTLSASGGGTVTSVALSGGTTGLTVSGSPITTSGTITLAGTLAIANGGTGQTTAAAALSALGGINTGKSIAMAMIFGF